MMTSKTPGKSLKHKTMKTNYIFLFAIGAVIAYACNKVEAESDNDAQTPNQNSISEIKAEIVDFDSESTKTLYDENGLFSWASGDYITVVVYHDGTGTQPTRVNEINRYPYQNKTGVGPNATFEGSTISAPWHEEGIALYPNESYKGGIALVESGTHGDFQVQKKQEITPDLNNPMAAIPLIGRKNDQGVYQFKTATGILKITLTDIPADAKWLYLEDPNQTFAFSGNFRIGERNEIRAEDAVNPSGNNFKTTIAFTPQAEGETRTFYIPVPTGDIPVGTTLNLHTGSSTEIFSKTFTKKVTITANHVTPIKGFAAETWNTIEGTGKFMDDNGFYVTGFYGRNADNYVDVTIQRSARRTNFYRVVNPYQAYVNQKGTSAYLASNPVGPDANMYFKLEDGFVSFLKYYSGVNYSNSTNGEFYIEDPAAWGYNKWNNCVIKYDTDGVTPLNVQLSPFYFYKDGASYTLCHENPKIEIVFPGSSKMLTCDNYPNKVSATRVGGNTSKSYTFTWTAPDRATITRIEAAVATSLDDAVSAIKTGASTVKTTNSSGTTLTFDNISSAGTYYLVYKVCTDGSGYTFKSTSFNYYSGSDVSEVTGSYVSGAITVEAADDKAGYNVKITKFAGKTFSSPLYGQYENGSITVPASDWTTTVVYSENSTDYYLGQALKAGSTATSPYSDFVISVPYAGRITASGYKTGLGTISENTFTLSSSLFYTDLAASRQ